MNIRPAGGTRRRPSWSFITLAFSLAAVAACSPSDPPSENSASSSSEETAVDPLATGEVADTSPVATGTLAGIVPPASGGFPSVVILEPEDPEEPEGAPQGVVPADEPAIIDQYGMAFVPNVLVVRSGQTVEFRNGEDVLHNVHVVDRATNATIFNIATPAVDSVFRQAFESPGTYSVLCDVHAAMAAFIIVTSSPYSAVAHEDGAFELPGVPHGSYTMSVWNVDEARQSQQVVTVEGPRTEVLVEQNR